MPHAKWCVIVGVMRSCTTVIGLRLLIMTYSHDRSLGVKIGSIMLRIRLVRMEEHYRLPLPGLQDVLMSLCLCIRILSHLYTKVQSLPKHQYIYKTQVKEADIYTPQ